MWRNGPSRGVLTTAGLTCKPKDDGWATMARSETARQLGAALEMTTLYDMAKRFSLHFSSHHASPPQPDSATLRYLPSRLFLTVHETPLPLDWKDPT